MLPMFAQKGDHLSDYRTGCSIPPLGDEPEIPLSQHASQPQTSLPAGRVIPASLAQRQPTGRFIDYTLSVVAAADCT